MSVEDQAREPMGPVNFRRSIMGTVLRVAWPVALSTLLTQLMVIVDTFWIGRLESDTALAAVGVSGSILAILMAVAQFTIAPTMAFVSRYTGQSNPRLARGALFHSLVIGLVLGVVITAAGIPTSHLILGLFGASPDVAVVGTPYLQILFIILPFAYLSVTGFTALQATGDTVSPLIISVVTNVINLVLDPILILGWLGFPRLGIVGAGLATGIATVLNLVGALIFLQRKRLLAAVAIKLKVIGAFFKIGFFAMIQLITRPLTGLVMFYIVGLSGVSAQGAFTVGLRIIGIFFIFMTGISVATQSLVGQSLGAGKPQTAVRVVQSSAFSGVLLQVLLSVLLFIGAEWIMQAFSPGSEEIIRIGANYLQILAPFLLMVPLGLVWSGAQYGAGRTLGPAVAAVTANWLVKLPLAFIMSQRMGMDTTGVWVAIGISVVVETVVTGLFLATGKWKRSKL